ncbi:dolichyl-phosphate beta-glucosyltransferase [Ascoidea rubescens DSM 1968]|uniref:dolichyl-phosphate beta-glucosyltransferase n=1 Tax=Ascoidea rubescens DSM 1968 TaxID=1344418 RepID=A0A1D2VJ65_9ASCO|nr:glycosyltransferase family 2 protein [Ascoidea rubescens DSM 1968]ODV61600.1 glycosyltransferase family 2 protein [Ascoidea rubescens DSM 1968]
MYILISIVSLFVWLFILAFISVYLVVLIFSHNPRPLHEDEIYYTTLTAEKSVYSDLKPLPLKNSNYDPKSNILISLVIPCYNEINRIKPMLDDSTSFLKEKYGDDAFEILIVDDGSTDGTSNFILDLSENLYSLKPDQIRIIKLIKNRGKGGAVTHGLQYTRGKYSIFADADGASKFSDISKLITAIEKHQSPKSQQVPVVAVGSRAQLYEKNNNHSVVKRSLIRSFLMLSFHSILFIFGIRNVKDSQCGFKLFNKAAIQQIFPYMHNERFIFDVEILMIANHKKIPIEEVPISWHEVSGSKVDLARDSIKMAIDLIVTRFAYLFGIYKDYEVVDCKVIHKLKEKSI